MGLEDNDHVFFGQTDLENDCTLSAKYVGGGHLYLNINDQNKLSRSGFLPGQYKARLDIATRVPSSHIQSFMGKQQPHSRRQAI